jgi:predicted nucleic acid-binding protein
LILVDTSFWAALQDRRDDRHELAVSLMRQYGAGPLVTTNHIRGEAWTLLRRRAGHADAVHFFERLDRSPRVRVVFVTEQQEEDARSWLRRHDEKPYSYVDATSFLVMRSLRLAEALTFDSDFAAAGFRVVDGRDQV